MADIGKARIPADAAYALGQSEPDRPMGFERFGQGTIVDERAAHGLDAASLLQNVGPHEHATPGSRRDRAPRPVYPGEGVKHLEEENERRNSDTLGEALAVQFDHERRQNEGVMLGMPDQPAD